MFFNAGAIKPIIFFQLLHSIFLTFKVKLVYLLTMQLFFTRRATDEQARKPFVFRSYFQALEGEPYSDCELFYWIILENL